MGWLHHWPFKTSWLHEHLKTVIKEALSGIITKDELLEMVRVVDREMRDRRKGK